MKESEMGGAFAGREEMITV